MSENIDLDQIVNDYNFATGDSDTMPREPVNASERRIALPTSAPNRLSEVFIDYNYGDDGRSLIRRYAGEFHEYVGGWRLKDRERLRAEIRGFADRIDIELVDKDGEPTGTYKPVRVTTNLVNEIENALVRDESLAYPTIVTGDRPQWLDCRQSPPARRVIAFRNGLLDVDEWMAGRVKLLPLTPDWFGATVCAFNFNADAPEPVEWSRFVRGAWPDDEQQIRLLGQWMGYCLTGNTQFQKMMLLIGPKRSGKGTIARVITHLIGRDNIAAPTLASLGTNFGLWPLINAGLAIVGDARLSGRSDQAPIVERLLSISGEDSLTIDRKNMAPVTQRLPTRIMMLSNELPRLADASGALVSRLLILQMKQSHYGHEDHHLTERLIAEAPGVILWALHGLRDLYQDGHFAESDAVAATMVELEDLSSPVRAFARDCLEVAPGPRTLVSDLFAAWRYWCEQEGREPGQKNVFTRDFHAAFPAVVTKQIRVTGGIEESRARVLDGVRIRIDVAEASKIREAARAR